MYYPVDGAKITSEKKEFRAFSYGQKNLPPSSGARKAGDGKVLRLETSKKLSAKDDVDDGGHIRHVDQSILIDICIDENEG